MKGLLIYRVDLGNPSNSGVLQKLKGQYIAYQSLGVEIDTVHILNNALIFQNKKIKQLSGISTLDIHHRSFWKAMTSLDLASYDIIHLRYPYSTPYLVRFIKELPSNLQLIIEFPTYPYAQEFKAWKKVLLYVDKVYRPQVLSRASHCIHYGTEIQLLGLPCVNITNGINISSVKERKPTPSKDQQLNLLAIGKWQNWHGLDRLLKGIAASVYKDIELTIIGEGPENTSLTRLVKALELEDQVKFLGNKIGAELDRFFDPADIAVGTLGMHRKGVEVDASLKHREYAARGIPFIYAGKDPDFLDCNFALSIPKDESYVDIALLYHLKNKKLSSKKIRNYAEKNLAWESRITKVLSSSIK